MSSGPSLYRRHRPRTFADVVGQEHVVRTLSHAVERDKVHHAYLFVGSRGTGKTSMAKILASCLNCVDGPTVTPCGVCDSCVSIANATSLDVIEMDAASNNSVDDIRELRETVAYAPVSGRSKVYILDEAHMLSSQAWNAFLKTLEEPPPSTVFVLATTEAQKVLPTVVDRCHRFDFGRPAADQIAGLLRRVAGVESIDLDDGAAALIARHATGSYRDALGTLEQLVDYVGDAPVRSEDVLAVLGVADSEQLFSAVDAVINRDPGAALGAAAALAASGRDPGQVLRDLESHARELLTVQVLGDVPAELAVTPDRDARLVRQAGELAPTDAVRLLDLVSGALEAAANGAQPRIQLELVLVRAAAPEFDPSVKALLSRVERLEQGGAVRAVVRSPASVPSPALDGDRAGEGTDAGDSAAPGGAPGATSGVASDPGAAVGSDSGAGDPVSLGERGMPSASVPPPAQNGDGAGEGTDANDSAGERGAPDPPESVARPPAEPAVAADSVRTSGPAEAAPPAPPAPGPAHVGLGVGDLGQMRELWPAVVELVRGQNGLLAAALAGASPVSVSEAEMVLALPADAAFVKRKLDGNEAHRRMTAEAVRSVTGASLELSYELAQAGTAVPVEAAEADDTLSESELVRRFVEEFDAQELTDDQETT